MAMVFFTTVKSESLRKNIYYFFRKNEFMFLFFVLVAFIFLPAFFIGEKIKDALIYIFLMMVLLVGVLELSDYKNGFGLGIVIAFLAVLFNSINFSQNEALLFTLRMGSLIVFFGLLSYHVFVRMLNAEKISINIIFAALNGYLLLGLIGGMGFRLIDKFYPHSFMFQSGLEPKIDDLTYFSFVTLSSIGYGDITPVSAPGQSLSVFLSICGQMYTAIVVGIIIGKFILGKNEN